MERVYDLSLKALFDDSPEDLIRPVLGEGVALESVRLEPTETLILERKLDRLARVRAGGEEFLFLPEFKASYEADIDRQIFTYVGRASAAHGFLPVWPVVYYLTQEDYPRSPRTAYVRSVLGRRLCEVGFSEVRLFEWNAEEVLRRKAGALLALVPLMKGAEERQIVKASRSIEELPRPEEVRRDYQIVLALLAGKAFPELDLDRVIPRELYMGSTFYERIVEEGFLKGQEAGREVGREAGRQEGREEGREAGRQEGRQEGREEGRRSTAKELALKLLEKKLGHPPREQDCRKIEAAGAEALQRLVLELALVASPAQTLDAIERFGAETRSPQS
jgi:hypothetical protein